MRKKKNTKRTLLMSVLSLMMCVTMLIGSTFAWFTDSVTSAGNVIKSGKLDVTMEWKDATKTGTQTTYKDASEGAIFNNDLWEPGYVEAKNIKINNIGTLALKYNLNIAADGEVSELAKVIDVYFAEGEYTLTDRSMSELTKVGTLSDILAGMPANMTGDLLADTADTVTIALKMQESAGNEYQDLAIGSDFSVVLMATQDTVEKDSFDETYDETEIPVMDIRTIDGVTYGIGNDGNYYMISVDDYSLTNFTVDKKVTVLGTGDGLYDNDRVFGKEAPLTSLALPEGLVEIKDNALNALPNLTTVNLPSTLKTIGIQAFKMTGMSELTVPASVETIKQGAFRDMANLTTVTVKGNVSFDKYAFRSCPNLTSIYLMGDDVQFTGSQFATHADNGDANGITIYVKNAIVAARVYAAQTSAYGYEVKILGNNTDGSDAQTAPQVTDSAQLDAAISGGATALILGSGNYIIPDSAQDKTLTIVGNGNTVVATQDDGSYEGCDYSLDGATVTFEGVTINTDSRTYTGYARCKGTYNNCTINGAYTLYGESVFNNCTFNVTGDTYNIWTWGAKTVKFNGCTFNTDGKSILVYNQSCDVYVDDCIFNDRTNGTGFTKSVFETGVDGVGPKYNIYINETTVNGFAENDKCVGYKNIVGNKNSLTNEYLNIVIDGVDVY